MVPLLEEKVAALVEARFGGDYRKAFDHYDSDHDGKVSKDELMALLQDAGIGNFLTRSTWAASGMCSSRRGCRCSWRCRG